MEWTKLTPGALKAAASECGLAVLPLGSIEAHAGHLPLGNDTFKAERTCLEAAEAEPAVVLPPLYYTDVASMRPTIGAISVRLEVIIDLVLDICDEAARNGFRKILLVSGHGGNASWLAYLRRRLLDRPPAYLVYTYYIELLGGEANRALMETPFDGHGGEVETSIALHLFPQWVDLSGRIEATTPAESPDLAGAMTPFDWPIRWPKAISGNPFPATADKGKIFYESNLRQLVACLRKVKEDTATPRFKDSFVRQIQEPCLHNSPS
ncbi:MAG: creatininase family protein [bacterium]